MIILILQTLILQISVPYSYYIYYNAVSYTFILFKDLLHCNFPTKQHLNLTSKSAQG